MTLQNHEKDGVALVSERPSLWRRFMGMVYESVILFGIYVAVGLTVLPIFQWAGLLSGSRLSLYQAALFFAFGIYFTYCWSHGGQTLPMKTLQMRLLCRDGRGLSWARSWLRYALAWSGLLAGASILAVDPSAKLLAFAAFLLVGLVMQLGAAFGPTRQALHDRLLHTEIILVTR